MRQWSSTDSSSATWERQASIRRPSPFEPDGVWSTTQREARAGVPTRAVDVTELVDEPPRHGRIYEEAEIWDNFSYFMERIIPIAEESGVRLALHHQRPAR